MARQIGRGGAADPVQIEQTPGDQAGIGQRTAADHAVSAVADQIDNAIADAEIDLDLRVAFQKAGQRRQQQLAGGAAAGIDAQHALRRILRLGQTALHLLQIRQPFHRILVIAFAFAGDRHAAGGALEQFGLQVILQILDQLGDRRFRHAQRIGGAGKAAGFHDAVKDPDSEQMMVHRFSTPCPGGGRGMFLQIDND